MTKEDVFRIMGKYYGNAYYRSAVQGNISVEDLQNEKEILEQVNSLGYYFSNTHRLHEIDDIRIVPIILEHWNRFENISFRCGTLGSIDKRSYSQYVPDLLAIFWSDTNSEIRWTIENCLLKIRSRKYVDEYLKIVNDPSYNTVGSLLIELLCKLHVKEVLPRFLELFLHDPSHWEWSFLRYAYMLKDDSILPYIEPYLHCNDAELRNYARRAVQRLLSASTPHP